jgi:CRISPR-associated protein Cmr5
MNDIKTTGQRYAELAWDCVSARVNPVPDAASKRYRARCRSLPVMILQCGLAQTVAFCQSRQSAAGDPYRYGAWLADIEAVIGKAPGSLATASRSAALQDYMHLTHQVLHAASWIKSYAEALIPRGDDDDNDDEDRGQV